MASYSVLAWAISVPVCQLFFADLGLSHVAVLVVGRDGVHAIGDTQRVFQFSILPVGVFGAPALCVDVRSFQAPIYVPLGLGLDGMRLCCPR